MSYNCAVSVKQRATDGASCELPKDLDGSDPRDGRMRVAQELVGKVVFLVDS
jgi:hypothetical protein